MPLNTPEALDTVNLDSARTLAIALAEKAATEVLQLRSENKLDVRAKRHEGDIVTKADRVAEDIIVNGIKAAFPFHSIRGEEGGGQRTEADWEWIIDPIDGTMNFVNHEEFGISIGLLHKGEPVMGVILFPQTRELAHAIKGSGTYLRNMNTATEERIVFTADTIVDLAKATVNFDFSTGDRASEAEHYLLPLVRQTRYPKIIACSTVSILAMLHKSRDAYVHPGATPYDIAAATIIIQEASGHVAGVSENNIRFETEYIPVIFANQKDLLHQLRELFV
ncbi:MAG: inositol monophosphatase [Candidatus Peribacteria bacterium]|nr:inositol monophosphatase [Candidatus Peribacteria bacterium]